MRKILKYEKIMIMKEEHEDRVNGRRAYKIEVCTGFKRTYYLETKEEILARLAVKLTALGLDN